MRYLLSTTIGQADDMYQSTLVHEDGAKTLETNKQSQKWGTDNVNSKSNYPTGSICVRRSSGDTISTNQRRRIQTVNADLNQSLQNSAIFLKTVHQQNISSTMKNVNTTHV